VNSAAANDFSAIVQQFRCYNAQQAKSVATTVPVQWQEAAQKQA